MALRLEDRELVITYQAGDDEAFAELVRKYRPKLLSHARRRLICAEAAEDAVQETFVRALRAMPRFNGDYMVGPWLHRILANVCIDEGNRRRREHEKTERAAATDPAPLSAPCVERELGLDLDLTDVTDAVGGLSEPYREALQMRFVEELSYDEIAETAGVSEDNARARVSRARTALRSALRAVALAPLALVGLLRRGERAASAVAGHGSAAGSAAVHSSAAHSSAAHSSVASAMPLLTEAAPVASRAAAAVANAASAGVPVVAKAAVGLGLATAVITPTVDSPVHKATERVLPDSVVEVLTPLALEVPTPSAPVVVPAAAAPAPVEAAPAAVDSEPVAAPVKSEPVAAAVKSEPAPAAAAAAPQGETAASAEAATASPAAAATTADEAPANAAVERQAQGSAGVEGGTQAADQSATTAAAAAASTASDAEDEAQIADAQAGEAGAQGSAASDAADGPEAAAASAPVVTVVATSSVGGAALTFVPSGADRYDIAGTLSMTVATTTITTTDEGETVETATMSESVAVVAPSTAALQSADAAAGERRFSALLVFAPGDDGVSAEMRLAARGTANGDGSLAMTGFFSATGTESLPLAQRGNLSGTLTLDAEGLPASLTITLTP